MKKYLWLTVFLAAVCMTGCGSEQQSSIPAMTKKTTTAQTAAKVQMKSESQKLAEQLENALAERTAKQTEMNTKNQAYTNAQQAYTKALNNLESYKAEHEDIVPYLGKGTLGFFEYCGADDAVEVLKNAQYASSTKIGELTDATALDNMLQVFPHIKNCNIIREGYEVEPLKVTHRLMAIAESNLNWTDEHMESANQFDEAENFIFDEGNPFSEWYDTEKEHDGEHFQRFLNDKYVLTGFAYCTAKRSGEHDFSHLQVFSGKTEETVYTVDEYEAMFDEFFNAAKGTEAELNTLMKEAETAKSKADACQLDYEEAKEAYEKANETYEKAQKVYDWYT